MNKKSSIALFCLCLIFVIIYWNANKSEKEKFLSVENSPSATIATTTTDIRDAIFTLHSNKYINEEQDVVYDSCVAEITSKLRAIGTLATFEQYPVKEIYDGKVAPLDLNSSFIARKFKTAISNEMKNGVNFAGHYIIASWAFTGFGSEFAIIDAVTGKAYVFPYVARLGFDFKKDSNLIIMDPPEYIERQAKSNDCIDPPRPDIYNDRTYYFLWENNSLKLIGPKDTPPTEYRRHLAP